MRSFSKLSALLLLTFLSLNVGADIAEDKLIIGAFSTGTLDHWEAKEFKGATHYKIVDLAGTNVLKQKAQIVRPDYSMNNALIYTKHRL